MVQFEVLRKIVGSEKGAELVEWAIWVGAIAVVAAAASAGLGPAISGAIGGIISAIGGS